MRRLLTKAFLALLLSVPAIAQQGLVTGTLYSSASTCQTTNPGTSCLFLPISTSYPSPVSTVAIGVTGTFAATLQFEVSPDGGTTWVSVSATPSSGGSTVTSTTATGVWTANVAGYTFIRVRCSAYTSGVASVSLNPSSAVTASSSGGGTTIPLTNPGVVGVIGGAVVVSGNPNFKFTSGTQTATIAATNLCAAANCPAGLYNIDVYYYETGGVGCTAVGTGKLTPTLSWTDDSGAKSGNPAVTFAGAVLTFTTGGTGANGFHATIFTSGAQPIQFTGTVTACTTPGSWTGFNVKAVVTPIGAGT